MKMLVVRVLAHGEGDPMVTVGGVEMATDHGTVAQKIHAHEVRLECADEGYSGHLHMMVIDPKMAELFVEGETVDVSFGGIANMKPPTKA